MLLSIDLLNDLYGNGNVPIFFEKLYSLKVRNYWIGFNLYCISQIYYNFTCREQYIYKFIRKFQYIYKRISIKLDAFFFHNEFQYEFSN